MAGSKPPLSKQNKQKQQKNKQKQNKNPLSVFTAADKIKKHKNRRKKIMKKLSNNKGK